MWLMYCFLLVTCSLLTAPNNGNFSCSLGGNNIANPEETCNFTCNSGYQLTVSGTRTCQNDGKWSGNDVMCISE